ncbi:hypothetical protein THAOC_02213 [Thalassiosira oceanica]|uniref:Peptidase M48 domain-containing protein n=1 Tax=Thalassiosira oceanica TaxID=159749 RepID=K0TG66_THAOC|nr:hypothetical protein THAOC_02213 [Thalassiosira oceanica]|mmetsp:Transcript_20815/g.48881  ORF Transcript_20815/g.48881 Transcript_20815/m.48881 type:complete len:306 (-) Transcript_20815:84-1001(-)|eukprot:EJK76044.1 hypothetical protein THAOC_02213 [Thalassiosira oceanica]
MIKHLAGLLLVLCASATDALSSSAPGAAQRVKLAGISASQFRHPLDRDLTDFLRRAPLSGLAEGGIRRALAVAEQATRLDLLSSSVKVSEEQLPELHATMADAAATLDLSTVPELYVQNSPMANAYTLALRSEDRPPLVVVTSALLDRCNEDEVRAIIGHELGHLKSDHSLYLTLGGLAAAPLRGLPLVGGQAERLLQEWRLAAEYTCDRAALLVAQDVDVVAGAMLKLFAGTARATNAKAFIDQAREYDRLLESANPLVRNSIRMQQRTHPLPVRRLAELEKWFQGEAYAGIVGSRSSDVDPAR